MTFHFGSVVEFGLFFTRISESLLSGASLLPSVELIRAQLHGVAAAVRVEDRFDRRQGTVIVAEADACRSTDAAGDDMLTGTREEARLAELLETCHSVTASTFSEVDDVRCTLWVFRERSEPAFDDEESSVCEILASQLRRGMELSRRIGASETERSLYSSVMDRLSVGVVILDLNGRVVRCSAKAEEALAARDGLQLQASKLRATSAREDRELQEAIKAAIHVASTGEKKSGRGLALTRPSGCRNLGIIIQSVPAVHEDGVATAPMVAIYIRDPEANADVENELVRQLFDLTPAEAAVARRLAAGLSLEDAASSLDISRNTARAHLRSIFSKSGITRQTELVRLMLNSAVVLGEPARQVA